MTLHATVQALGALGVCAAVTVCTLYVTKSTAQNANEGRPQALSNASPIYGVTIPAGYRDWKLVSVGRLSAGNLKQVRAVLGNDVAIKAYREGTLPFPDGAIIARLAWSLDASDENNRVFGRQQSFVAGKPKNGLQFMVRDSKRFAATGGWGFAQFDDGKAVDDSKLTSCFPCHAAIRDRDLVFTRYAR